MAAARLEPELTRHARDASQFAETAPVLVIGGGPAGIRCAERLGAADTEVVVLTDEPWLPYDRVRLSALLARDVPPDALDESRRLEACARLTVLTRRRVVRIDRASKFVEDHRGERFGYAKLVLAIGSRPRLPPVPGIELPGVFVFRDLSDAQRLLARQVGSRSTVVIGGGLLGLEAARAMQRFKTRVCVIEHEPRLMFNQLDVEASAHVRAAVERLGIEVRVGASVQQISGGYRPSAVHLKGGEEIACDTVIVATGIVPNVELARAGGISVGRGIRVDDQMRTSDGDVYAVGECCEHRGRVYGLVGPGIEQAAVAADNILGRDARYVGSLVASSLKVAGCAVFSMGEVGADPTRYQSYRFERGSTYRRLNVARGRLVGAVGFGEWDVARLRMVALEERRLWPWQLLRFARTGELWSAATAQRVGAWPATTTVCTCRAIARGALSEAIEGGARDVEALSRCTGAGTVCGSCKPLLAALFGTGQKLAIPRALLGTSAVGAALAAAAYVVSLPYRATVEAALEWDLLWTSSLIKQSTGFSLLALGALVSVLSFRKRIARFTWGRFSSWQLAHTAFGVLVCLALAAHTGFRSGANLNAWLMFSFTGLLVAGGVAGVATALSARLAPARARALRSSALWIHILLLWPLPALLGFHVLKSYYF